MQDLEQITARSKPRQICVSMSRFLFHFRQRFPSLFALWLHCISNKHHYTLYNEASIVRKSLGRLLEKVSLLKRFLKRKSVGLHVYTLVSPGMGKVDKHFSYLHRMRQ